MALGVAIGLVILGACILAAALVPAGKPIARTRRAAGETVSPCIEECPSEAGGPLCVTRARFPIYCGALVKDSLPTGPGRPYPAMKQDLGGVIEPENGMIQWDESLSVGIPEVDADHQRFILLVNDLNWAIGAMQRKPELERRLGLVVDDAKSHFEYEERLFALHGYPDADRHAALHAELSSRLVRLLKDFDRSDDRRYWAESGLEIMNLLLEHLRHDDRKCWEFLRSRICGPGA